VLERVLATIERYSMLEGCRRVGAAVSGGADSVCLLHVLHELAPRLGVTIHVLHLDHGLRGAASAGDAGFVRELAVSLGLPVHSEAVDLRSSTGNLEQAGRSARREFFLRLCSEGVIDRIATGHTRSDQAETVMYRLLRGSGTAGLAGILPVTAEGFVRPLLDCSRADVEAYLRDNGLAWREDATNRDRVFVRNRIRHELMPVLVRDYNPSVQEVLAATASVARDEEEFWERWTRTTADKLFIRKPAAVILEVSELLHLHPAEARRVLRRGIREVKSDLRGIEILHVEAILGLAHQADGHGRIQAPGIDVFRSFEWLRIGRPETRTRFERDYAWAATLSDASFLLGDTAICLEIQEQDASSVKHYNERADELDAERIGGPLELRNWHPGDEFQPVGRSRTKIKTLFQEARVPIWERHRWPVLVSGSEIIWTREFGAAEAFVARTPPAGRILRVYEKEAPGQSR
jgi:tRNA(Ile)-lysidine synthase